MIKENYQKKIENTDTQKLQDNPNTLSVFLEIIKFAILALIIVVPIRMYIASPFVVNGASMSPTFETGHYLIVDEISYRFENPERGDVIVFKYPNDTSKYFIKRVIGLPGETIQSNNGAILIKNEKFPSGFKINEPYVKLKKNDIINITLKDDEYFVMGDNRKGSSDSRVWGPLNEKFIRGEALLRLFPMGKMGLYPGKFNN